MSSTIKLCKDCKHFVPNDLVMLGKCVHPKIGTQEINYVNGEKRYWLAQTLRNEKTSLFWKTCGPNGKYWEPK